MRVLRLVTRLETIPRYPKPTLAIGSNLDGGDLFKDGECGK